MAELFAAILFIAGYGMITMEQKLFVNKAATSTLLAVALWTITALTIPSQEFTSFITQSGSDLFGLLVFLLTAMTLVEILIHYHAFDVLESWLRKIEFPLYNLAWALMGITYVASMFIANLTITIIMIQIARRLFPKQLLIPVAIAVVIASNTGGSTSPIGDVNTIMLWFAHKFTAFQIIGMGLIPSLLTTYVAGLLLFRKIPKTTCADLECANGTFKPSHSDTAIIITALVAFLLPLGASVINIPAYMGLLLGLGLVWVMIDFAKRARPQTTHLQANIQKFMQQTDIESIQFFIGILLSVGALNALGVLQTLTHTILGAAPTTWRIAEAFVGIGFASAIVDNIPLTAAAINSLPAIPANLWVLLALCVTSGGSLLIIGSASGVVAMGMIKELSFGKYFKVGFVPALLGFSAGIITWVVEQYATHLL
jgi:Na+/H+ antiporter NhaD/arsenite permease-like protein